MDPITLGLILQAITAISNTATAALTFAATEQGQALVAQSLEDRKELDRLMTPVRLLAEHVSDSLALVLEQQLKLAKPLAPAASPKEIDRQSIGKLPS